MRTEVYINDSIIDLNDEETVTATYGNISFGEFNKRKGIKSNAWKATLTQRNKLVFEGAELVNSYSDVAYRKGTIRVEIDGVVVFEGWCVLEESNEVYEIRSYAGASDFYSQVTTKKLTQVNLSAFDHIWNEPNIRNSWTRTDGYIYAHVNYGKGTVFFTEGNPPDFFLPQIFFHSVVRAIVADAGYTIEGNVLTDPRFLNHIVIPNKFPLTIQYGGNWIIASLLPDLTQAKLWLDFANIYGLQFDINDVTKVIRADYIDDMLFNEPEDWTSKVDRSEKRRIEYHWDEYGQTSYLKYKSEVLTPTTPVYQAYEKEVLIDDQTLKLEGNIYESDFFMIQDTNLDNPGQTFQTFTFIVKPEKGYGGIWNPARSYVTSGNVVYLNGSYYQPIQDSLNQNPPSSPLYWKSVAEKDVWDMKSRPMYGALQVDVSSEVYVAFDTPLLVTRVITNKDMDWVYAWNHHYRVFKRIIERSKIVEDLMKLNYADISQLDFTKMKRIDNELYLLEEVRQFRLNEVDSTQCNFVRI